MSARFTCNFVVLIVGAGLLVVVFAFSMPTADWIALGAGSVAVVMALYSFAATDQGVYQRIADAVICALGAWAIVAARVMNYQGRWLVFGAGAGLAVLGAVGLLVRERTLALGLRVGRARIDVDEFGRLGTVQRDAEAGR
ncbi:MAG: hypothetical protein WAL22_12115 [Solirubrobacteraceae bacterium]